MRLTPFPLLSTLRGGLHYPHFTDEEQRLREFNGQPKVTQQQARLGNLLASRRVRPKEYKRLCGNYTLTGKQYLFKNIFFI